MSDWLVAEVSTGVTRYLNLAAGRKGDPWPSEPTRATRFFNAQVARDVAAEKQRKTPWLSFKAVPAEREFSDICPPPCAEGRSDEVSECLPEASDTEGVPDE